MKLAILLLCSVVCVLQAAMTTHRPKEPNEFEQLLFFYNRDTRHLLLKESDRTSVNCYMHKMNATQLSHIHSDFGMKNQELYMLGHQNSATRVKMSELRDSDVNWCKHGIGNRTITFYSL